MHSQALHDLYGLLTDSGQLVYRQRRQEVALFPRRHFDEPIRFGKVRGNLGDYFTVRDADLSAESQFTPDSLLHGDCHL